MTSGKTLFTLAMLAAIAGCQQPTKTAEQPANTETPPTASTTGTSAATDTGQPEVKLEVPVSLKGKAFAYYGLGYSKPLSYKITQGGQDLGVGTTSYAIKQVKAGKVWYEATRTGSLASIGNSSLVLSQNGVYTDGIMGTVINPPQLELPNDLNPGKAWESKANFELNGQKIELNMKNQILSPEPIETALGKFEAVRVSSKGTTKMGATVQNTEAMIWLVRDLGIVKLTSTSKSGDQTQTQTMTVVKE